MPRSRQVSIRRTLRKLLPPAVVSAAAVTTGAFRRVRKVDPNALVWTLILGFSAGKVRTLASLRRVYQRITATTLEESSFYDRFTPALGVLLRTLLERVIDKSWGIARQASGRLRRFRDILITDSTVVRLHDLLARAFPACRTNHTRAAAKVHVVMCAAGAGKQTIKLTPERRHDRRAFVLGPWVRGKLILLDQGYFDFRLFRRIDDLGGYFVTRLKRSSNPVIVDLNRRCRGRAVSVVCERIWDVVDRLQRQELDVVVQVRSRHRAYGGRQASELRWFRAVGVRDKATGDYHVYLTNIPCEALSALDIAATYAVRWEVELLFKELKSQYRIDQIPSRKRHVVQAMLYAALLTLAASRALLHALRHAARPGRFLPAQRWGALVSQYSHDLLRAVVAGKEDSALVELLLHEAPDPNRRRVHLLQSAERGLHVYDPRPRHQIPRRHAA